MRSFRALVLALVIGSPATTLFAQSILTIAGGGTDDGRPATVADLNYPTGLAIASTGDLYIADWNNHRIRKVAADTGIITTAAGNGSGGFTGDGGPATAASLFEPMGVVLDPAGNLFIADTGNGRVRRVDRSTGVITTVAGSGRWGFGGDGGPATAAQIAYPTSVAFGPAGDLFIVDSANNRLRKVSTAGIITTIAGNGTWGYSGDGGPAVTASLGLSGYSDSIVLGQPPSVTVDAAGVVYFTDTFNNRVRKVDTSGIITTIAGNGTAGLSGDNGPGTAASLREPTGILLDSSRGLLISDTGNARVRSLSLVSGTIYAMAGTYPGFAGDGDLFLGAAFSDPIGLASNAAGDLFIADKFNDRVRRITFSTGIISTYAGSGVRFSGDGGAATSALILGPAAMAIDANGAITISEYEANRIRRLGTDGRMSTLAGKGPNGGGGDGGPAIEALLDAPGGVAIDPAGNLYFADCANNRIRRVAAATGIITTVAGTSTSGFSGDGGPAASASLNLSSDSPGAYLVAGYPSGVALDGNGDLYFADTFNNRIRKIAASTQIISTIAGTGTGGLSGDGGAASAAQMSAPTGIALDRNQLYVADTRNNRIRRIDLLAGTITTIAGSGASHPNPSGFGGDGGPATAALLYAPTGIAIDTAGNLYIADKFNLRIRKISSGIITTIVGSGQGDTGFTGDGGSALLAGLSDPYGVAVDKSGNVYIADTFANRVRVVYACVTVAAPVLMSPASGVGGLSTAPTLTWNRVSGAFRYDIYLSTSNPPALIASDVTSTAYTPSNLMAGATYYWRIVAKGDPFCYPASTASSEVRSFTTASGCAAPPSLDLSQPADGASGLGQSVQLSWVASTGAGTYDVYFGPSNPPALFAGGISATTQSVSGLSTNTRYYWSVAAHAQCDASKVRSSSVRSFQTGGACVAAGSFSLTSPRDGSSGAALTTTLQWTAATNASGYDVYLGTSNPPPVYLVDLTRTSAGVSSLLPSRTYFWRVVAKVACDPTKNVPSAVASFTTTAACAQPATPTITFVPPGNVGVGQTYSIAWQEVTELDETSYYTVERSTTQAFTSILDAQQTFSTSASFIANSAGTYYHRVRATRSCDPSHPGQYSDVRAVNVVTGTANVIFTVQPQALVTSLGDKLEDRKSSFTIENLGASSLQVILGKGEIGSVPFFTINDPLGGDSVFVTLEPRKPKTFDLRFSGPPNNQAGAYQGVVFIASTGQGLAITPYAFVNLKVGGLATARPQFLSNGAPTEYAFFPGFAGDDAARAPITIDIRNSGSSSMELAAEIGPEVWLVPESGWNASAIPPGASRTVRLYTQRNRAPNGSALPRYTYFTIRSKSGESARLLVQDNDAVRTGAGRTSLLDPGSRSYVIPGVVSGTSAGAPVITRLRLTNVGSDPVQADLFFTPSGADGFDMNAVKRATIVVPPNDVVTLTDPIVQVFGVSAPAEGEIEVRAAPERIGFLLVAASVISAVPTGGAQTYQLPTLRLGEGARIGSAHAVAGISTSTALRTSVLLAETSGTEAANVRLTIYNGDGVKAGETAANVPRYGQRSIDINSTVAGSALNAGRIDIDVQSGGGSVAGVLLMLDSAQNSGAMSVSQPASASVSAKAMNSLRRRILGSPLSASAVVPVVLNGQASASSPSTTYRTSMGFTTTGSAGAATITFRPDDPTAFAVAKSVQLVPNLVVNFENVLEQLFGIGSGAAARGGVYIEGGSGAQVYARLLSSTGGAAWRLAGSLPIFPSASEVMTSLASKRPLYLDGLEQSIDSTRGTRWAVALNETSGNAGTVRLRLYEAGNRSVPIAEKTFSIRPWEQLRLDTIFAALGLDTAERRKDRTNVLCVIAPESGNAIVSAVGVATDNATGGTSHLVFSPGGGVPATGVLRLSIVVPVTPESTPAQSPNRKRAVRP